MLGAHGNNRDTGVKVRPSNGILSESKDDFLDSASSVAFLRVKCKHSYSTILITDRGNRVR